MSKMKEKPPPLRAWFKFVVTIRHVFEINRFFNEGFEVLTALSAKMAVFWYLKCLYCYVGGGLDGCDPV